MIALTPAPPRSHFARRATRDVTARRGEHSKTHGGERRLQQPGARFYSSELGRWICRDPVEEHGGLNLLAFIRNGSVNDADMLGLISWFCDVYCNSPKGNPLLCLLCPTELGNGEDFYSVRCYDLVAQWISYWPELLAYKYTCHYACYATPSSGIGGEVKLDTVYLASGKWPDERDAEHRLECGDPGCPYDIEHAFTTQVIPGTINGTVDAVWPVCDECSGEEESE
jgi:RHS repeat-associated protein